jgi:hypothetical protein
VLACEWETDVVNRVLDKSATAGLDHTLEITHGATDTICFTSGMSRQDAGRSSPKLCSTESRTPTSTPATTWRPVRRSPASRLRARGPTWVAVGGELGRKPERRWLRLIISAWRWIAPSEVAGSSPASSIA